MTASRIARPVVTDPKKAVLALKWAVREMEERTRRCRSSACATSTATSPGRRRQGGGESVIRTVQTGFERRRARRSTSRRRWTCRPCPTSWLIVDEMADLMMVAGKDMRGRSSGWRRWRGGRHPPDHGHAAPVGRRDHRHDQGTSRPDLLPGDLEDRQPHHPDEQGPSSSWAGRHAAHGRRRADHPGARALSRMRGEKVVGISKPRASGLSRHITADEEETARRRPTARCSTRAHGRRFGSEDGGDLYTSVNGDARQEVLDPPTSSAAADRLQPRASLVERMEKEGCRPRQHAETRDPHLQPRQNHPCCRHGGDDDEDEDV